MRVPPGPSAARHRHASSLPRKPQRTVDVRATFAERLTIDQLARFTTSVLVAYGGASPPAASAIATALAGSLPRARSQVVPGAAHGMLDSHSDALADLILAADEVIS